jgi:hypothetical protein
MCFLVHLIVTTPISLIFLIYPQSMSFATIVLCDLLNVTKMILIVNVTCNCKFVVKTNLKNPFSTIASC